MPVRKKCARESGRSSRSVPSTTGNCAGEKAQEHRSGNRGGHLNVGPIERLPASAAKHSYRILFFCLMLILLGMGGVRHAHTIFLSLPGTQVGTLNSPDPASTS